MWVLVPRGSCASEVPARSGFPPPLPRVPSHSRFGSRTFPRDSPKSPTSCLAAIGLALSAGLAEVACHLSLAREICRDFRTSLNSKPSQCCHPPLKNYPCDKATPVALPVPACRAFRPALEQQIEEISRWLIPTLLRCGETGVESRSGVADWRGGESSRKRVPSANSKRLLKLLAFPKPSLSAPLRCTRGDAPERGWCLQAPSFSSTPGAAPQDPLFCPGMVDVGEQARTALFWVHVGYAVFLIHLGCTFFRLTARWPSKSG
jgi:hypothetical protein